MQITSPLISRIGALTGVSEPEAFDSRRVIPNLYMSEMPFPVDPTGNLGGTVYSDSFHIANGETITNNAGGSTTLLVSLTPGIWRLSFSLDIEFNWLNANPLASDARLCLRAQPTPIVNLQLFYTAARAARTVIHVPELWFTLKDTGTLVSILNGNGVGQTSTINYMVTGARML